MRVYLIWTLVRLSLIQHSPVELRGHNGDVKAAAWSQNNPCTVTEWEEGVLHYALGVYLCGGSA